MLAPLLTALAILSTAHAGATASSFKPETKLGANYWNAASAVDGKVETCWMLKGEDENEGQWMMLDIPKGTVDKIGINIGWLKDGDTFTDYARIKELRVEALSYSDTRELTSVASQTIKFEDKKDWQIVDLTDMVVGTELSGGKLKMTVVSVYPGGDFPNLAVSELLVYLKEDDAGTINVISASGESAGHAKDSVVDDNPKSFWATAADGAKITLESPGLGISRVGLTPQGKDYARPKKVKVTAQGRSKVAELPDATTTAWVEVPSLTGYSGSAWGEIEIEVLETYPGAKSPELGISEIDMKWTTYEGL